MKIDLDEVERKARADVEILDGLHGDPFKRGGWIGQRYHARSVVALITRIRELERALDSWGDYSRYADKIRAMILKGATLP